MMPQLLFFIFIQLGPAEIYNSGNAYYAQGDYKNAIEAYEQALERTSNKELLYNLGNAYFKSGRIGRALVQYRRAWLISPRDEDVKHNILFARSYRVDRAQTVPNPFTAAVAGVFHFFSFFESSALAAASFFLCSLFAAWFLISRRRILSWGACGCGFLFLFFFTTTQVWQSEKSLEHAVVTVPEVSAYSGPGDEHKEILVLHDGTEVRIRAERSGYFLVQLPGGMGGWVSKESVERLFGVKS
jgi:tetratricopeptide (TPR) repeat protein